MNTFKSIVVVFALGYGALGCGPDSVNNYYTGKGGSSTSGNFGSYTCDDLGQAQLDCISQEKPELDQGYAAAVADVCRKKGISQDCIDCVATAPCTIDHSSQFFEDPLNYCVKQGICDPGQYQK